MSVGYRSSVVRDGAAVQLFAFDPGAGDPYPTILEGRRPTGADEIALGGQTLDRLDLSIGDEAEFRGPQGEAVELTVVGRTLLPLLSLADDLSVGEGGLVDVALVEHFGVNDPGIALVDLRDGASDAGVQAILNAAGDPHIGGVFASGPVLTADLRSYWQARWRCSASACSPTPSPRRCGVGVSSSRCSDPSASPAETSGHPSAGASSPSWPRAC